MITTTTMTAEEHRKRHKFLHSCLDELFADYISHHPGQQGFLDMPIYQLLRWSHDQSMEPDHVEQIK